MHIKRYTHQNRMLLAVDCIIFGFDGTHLKLLLIKRAFEPQKGRWSLMGGFVQPEETLDYAASRILKQLTGLSDIYLEQLNAFSNPYRDPTERTVSVAYFCAGRYQRLRRSPARSARYRCARWPSSCWPVPDAPRVCEDASQGRYLMHATSCVHQARGGGA